MCTHVRMCPCSSLIRKHEWTFPGPRGAALASRGVYKFNALITSFQVLISDWEYLSTIRWRAVVVDEAHALKNRESQLQQALKSLHYDYILLLTGTPLQNDIPELWSLLNVIKPERYQHQSEFAAMYGQLKDSEQVQRLQQELAPIMLRRQKEDVEKSIPPKEETLVHVELTRLQKAYYRAVLERNRAFLLRGASSAPAASLMNIEMELRKCCDHPFLLSGAEQRETLDGSREHRIEVCLPPARTHARTCVDRAPPRSHTQCTPTSAHLLYVPVPVCECVQAMVSGSGKVTLLDKLLPKLREEGHRVLIFSQFKNMLNLIEELMTYRGYSLERIDGSVRGNERQAAIDRFNKPGSNIFAFLLSTKAGGQGINLTAADTVIIFDSDWNPQNDVQAMARAHRIGQTKDVRIYRLITVRTYEAEMFKRASRKLGLSQAVFESGGVAKRFDPFAGEEEGGDSLSGLLTMDKEKVEALLRFGAYAIMEDDEANAAASDFQASTIDQILSKSSTIRYDDGVAKVAELEAVDSDGVAATAKPAAAGAGSAPQGARRVGLNLSKATFAVDDSDTKLDMSDPSFWEKVLGPRPANALLRDLQESVLDDPVKTNQWLADLTAILGTPARPSRPGGVRVHVCVCTRILWCATCPRRVAAPITFRLCR